MLIDFHYDKETRSLLSLKKDGIINYALHPSTEATMITWALGRTGYVKCWRYGQPFPEELIDVATNPHKYNIIAHNLQFDYLIWTVVLPRQFPYIPFKRPEIKNLTDNMALTCHFRVGGSLESAAQMLRFPVTKDKAGRAIMLKQCQPGRNGVFPVQLTPAEWDLFELYGKQDTRLLRDIYYMMPPLPAPERWAWEWTFKRNLLGLQLDMNFIQELDSIVEAARPGLQEEFFRITNGFSVTSPKQCLAFFKYYYPEITDMTKETVEDLIDDERHVPPHVRRAIEIKDLTGSTSLTKIKVALRQSYNGRIYAFLAYHFAQTKRWAGRGLQIQNYARIDKDRPDKLPDSKELNAHDIVPYLRAARPHLKDPLGYCKNLLRRMFIPTPGKYFYCGDWSKIEPTVLFWLVGLGPIPSAWYEEMAAAIYDKPMDQITEDSLERQIGKMANLSCQYGTGGPAFKKAVKKQAGLVISETLAKHTVKTYRSKYPEVTRFWKDLENAFKLAVKGHSSQLCGGKVTFMPMEAPVRGVQIRLPSGGMLYYPHATIQEEKYEWVFEDGVQQFKPDGSPKVKFTQEKITYVSDEGEGKLQVKTIWGGVLCENVTSATAREIILPALYRLEEARFDMLALIHDEMWGESEPGRDAEYERLMCINPSWCLDMRITAGMKNGVRYLK